MEDKDDFGAKELLLEHSEKNEFGALDVNMSDDFGGKDIRDEDNSWGRFFLRKGRGLAAGATGLPGDLEKLIRESPKVRGKGVLGPHFYNEETYQPGEELEDEDRYLYSTQDVKNKIDKKAKEFGYDLEARGFWENAEDKALEFAGAGGTLGLLSKGAQGLKAASSLPELFSSAAMGLVSEAGETLDLPEPLKLASTAYAGYKGRKISPENVKEAAKTVKNVAKKASQPAKTSKEFTANTLAKIGKPKTEVIAAAERRGIKPALSNVIESRPVQASEQFLKESSLTGSAYEKKLSEINEQTKNAFERILDNVSTDTGSGRDIGETALKRLNNNFLESKENYTNLYENSNKAIPKGETVSYKNTQKNIREIRNSLEKTALVKGQRAETLKVLDEISSNIRKEAEANYIQKRLGQLVDSNGKKAKPTPNQRISIEKEAREAVKNGQGEISPSTLLGTEDSLNDFIDWYAQGGTKKTLKHIVRGTKEDIASYAQKNAKFGELYKQADKEFINHAKTLRSDLIKSIMKKEIPEEILGKMSNVSNIRKIEAALAQNSDGKKIMQSLKRAKLQELLESKMVDNEGKIKWGTFGTALKDPKKQDVYKELLGNQNYRRLQDVQKFSSDLANTTAKFANTSKTAVVGRDIAIAGGILAQFFLAMKTGGLSELVLALTKAGAEGAVLPFISKLLTDDDFIDLVIKAGKNAKNPQVSKFYYDKMTQTVLKALTNEVKDSRKEHKQEK